MKHYKHILLVEANTAIWQIGVSDDLEIARNNLLRRLEEADVIVVGYKGEKPELLLLDCEYEQGLSACGFEIPDEPLEE